MPGTLLRTRGPRGFQEQEVRAAPSRVRSSLAQMQEIPKIAAPIPGINQPLEPEKPRDPPTEKPVPKVDPVESDETGSEEGEVEEVEEVPRKPVKSAAQQELEQKFAAVKEPAPEEPKKKRAPRKKVVEVEEASEPAVAKKAPRKLSSWQLFMKQAKDFPEVKELPGKDRVKKMAELYKLEKERAKQAPVEEVVSL